MDEITLIVTYRCKDGKRGSFVRDVAAQGILDKILQEEGCMAYKYAMSATDEDELILIERWASEALQQAHLAREHMQQLKSIKERYVIVTTHNSCQNGHIHQNTPGKPELSKVLPR